MENPVTFWQNRWRDGETPWDHGSVAPPLREWLQRHPQTQSQWQEAMGSGQPKTGLVPGCGSGHEVRFLAQNGLSATGLDCSTDALAKARQDNAHPNATYVQGDFLRPETWLPPSLRYDYVFEHTCLCAMAPAFWPDYVNALKQILKPQGCLVGIFYVQTKSPEGPPFQISSQQIDALFDPDFILEESYSPQAAFASRLGRELLRVYRFTPSSKDDDTSI